MTAKEREREETAYVRYRGDQPDRRLALLKYSIDPRYQGFTNGLAVLYVCVCVCTTTVKIFSNGFVTWKKKNVLLMT